MKNLGFLVVISTIIVHLELGLSMILNSQFPYRYYRLVPPRGGKFVSGAIANNFSNSFSLLIAQMNREE